MHGHSKDPKLDFQAASRAQGPGGSLHNLRAERGRERAAELIGVGKELKNFLDWGLDLGLFCEGTKGHGKKNAGPPS